MAPIDIKFKTIQLISGIKHISESQFCIICEEISIEKTEENFGYIREACELYFNLMNENPNF